MSKLIIEPKTAKLFRDTETFGKMDPYVTLKCGGKEKKTKTDSNAGKYPKWKDCITLDVKSQDLTITVYDKDTFSDDKIGTKTIDVEQIRQKGGMKDWVDLMYKGKVAGEIYLEISYVGHDSGKSKMGSSTGGVHPGGGVYDHSTPSAHQYAPAPGGYAPAPGYAPTPSYPQSGYAPAPGGYAPAPGGYSPAPGGYAPAPGGYSQAPGGYAPAPGGYSPAPGGYSQAPGGYSQAPGGYAQAPGGYSQAPGGYAQAPGYAPAPIPAAPVYSSHEQHAPAAPTDPSQYNPHGHSQAYPTPQPMTYQQPSGPTYTPPGSSTPQSLYQQPTQPGGHGSSTHPGAGYYHQ